MLSFFQQLFDTQDFNARWTCGRWSAEHGWLHILSDIAIFGAYAAIPVVLIYYIRRRQDLPFPRVFWLFALFILSCGVGHLIEATLFWHPWYRFSGAVKAVTAGVSWMTVFALVKVLPQALTLPGLAKVNRQLTEQIHERERAETAAAQLAAIVESSDDAIISKDLTGIITSWNAGSERIFGYSASEVIGQSILRLIPIDRHPEEEHILEQLRRGAKVEHFETVRLRKNGEPVYVSVTVSPIKDGSGKIIGASKVARDITERRKSEAQLREVEERVRLATAATGVGIWEWNILTGQLRWDAQMFRIYGVTPTADGTVHYLDWSSAVVPEDLAESETILQETIRRGSSSRRVFRIRRRDTQTERFIEAVETTRANAQGQVEWVIGTNLDITERRRTERLAQEEARMKDEFLAMLGHELRNPLAAIRHAVQITAQSGEEPETGRWAGQVIDRQSQQLTRMVDDLLDVARINRGQFELRLQPMNLAEVIDSAIGVVRPLIDQRNHRLTAQISDRLWLQGDSARLEQVIVNLLTNAAKYTPRGGMIHLHAFASSETSQVVVTLQDNGLGITSDHLPQVFDLFRQAERTLDRSEGGLGIGLNVVKSLVEKHQGQVRIESPGPNQGTTVTLHFPLLAEPANSTRNSARADVAAPPGEPIRVLVVDDHVDAAKALTWLLKRRGFEVRGAHSGSEGLKVARAFIPDVLLLDLGLPEIDGYDLVRILRVESSFKSAFIIAISGYAEASDRARCLATGFDEHFSKPVELEKLIQSIRAHVEKGEKMSAKRTGVNRIG